MGRRVVVVHHTQYITNTIVAPVRTPSRSSDSLASKEYLTTFDLLSEGECEGFPSARDYERGSEAYNYAALKDIYFDGTPLLTSTADVDNLQDSDFNFSGVGVAFRYGTKDQAYIPGVIDYEHIGPETEFDAGGLEIRNDAPRTITLDDTSGISINNLNGVRIKITFPALQRFSSYGDIYGDSVELKIEVRYGTRDEVNNLVYTAYESALTDTVTGRSGDKYQRNYRIDFRPEPFEQVQIRLSRITPDAADTTVSQNAFYLTTYSALIYQKLRYPYSALAAIRIDSESISRIPVRTYRYRGVKVKIPQGVTVDQVNGRIVYPDDYIFTGELASELAWTTDPSWILYDLLTTRKGFKEQIKEAELDVYGFYNASKYSSALVDDQSGTGTLEPRFSCNALIQNQDEAFRLINDLCSVMRCMPYYSVGSLTISQDQPRDASYLFSQSNVSEKGFQYQGTSIKARHTVVLVSYLDVVRQQTVVEVVEDHEAIAKFGVVQIEIKAFACTSRGQARRLGLWLLYTEGNESSVVTFECGPDAGYALAPGQVIEISDQIKVGVRQSGRIVRNIDINGFVLDTDDNTNIQNGDTLSVVTDPGNVKRFTINNSQLVEDNAANQALGIVGRRAFYTDRAFDSENDINPNSIYVVSRDSLQTTTWRVLSIEDADPWYKVNAVAYNSSKFNNIEQGTPLTDRDFSIVEPRPSAPSGLKAEQLEVEAVTRVRRDLKLTWLSVEGVSKYRLRFTFEQGVSTVVDVNGPSYVIQDVEIGTYSVEVFSLNAVEIPSNTAATISFTSTAASRIPQDVSEFLVVPVSATQAIAQWAAPTDIEIKFNGQILIRHVETNAQVQSWATGRSVANVSAIQTQTLVPLRPGRYYAKFITSDGTRESDAAVYFDVSVPAEDFRVLSSVTADLDFTSTDLSNGLTDMSYDSTAETLSLASNSTIDDIDLIDDVRLIDNSGGIQSLGFAEFAYTLDLGEVNTVYFDQQVDWELDAFGANDIDNWPSVDDIKDIDNVSNFASVDLQIQVAFRNQTSDAWSAWGELKEGKYVGRNFKFRLKATNTREDLNCNVSRVKITPKQAGRTVSGVASVATSGTQVTFSPSFWGSSLATTAPIYYQPDFTARAIQSSQSSTDSYWVEVSALTGTSATLTVRNSSGTAVASSVAYNAHGYGADF